ncbi:MAG: hypothetical protein WCT04_01370 [Planctomycetota bacterium]
MEPSKAVESGAQEAGVSELRKRIDQPGFVFAILLLLSMSLIWANLTKPFYSFDDEVHIRVAVETPISSILFKPESTITYLPVSLLSHRLDRYLFGPSEPLRPKALSVKQTLEHDAIGQLNPEDTSRSAYFGEINWAPYLRAESCLFHVIAGFLLWAFLRRLNVGPGTALFIAAVWVAHPMACESVCWISERKNVQAAMFGFFALWAQTQRGTAWRWPLVTVLYFLSTLSKPTGVGVFPIIVALEVLDPNAPVFAWRSVRDWVRLALGLSGPFAVTVLIVWINMGIHQIHFVAPPGGSLFTALLTDLEIFSRYMFNIVLPVNLSFFYGLDPIRSLGDARAWIFGAVLVGVCVGTVWGTETKFRGVAVFGLIWFFGALGPTSNIAPIPYWMQDRYVYIASAGLLLSLTLCAQGIFARVKMEPAMRAYGPFALGFAFVLFIAVLSITRAPLFQDAQTLVEDAAIRQPKSGKARSESAHNHAYAAHNRRDPEFVKSGGVLRESRRALEEYDAAIQCADIDNFTSAFVLRVKAAQLMNTLGAQGDIRAYAEAREYLKDWLPPKKYTMHDPDTTFSARDSATSYRPQTLAYAWLVAAEARWMLAMNLDRKTVPVAARLAEMNAAIAEVDRSIGIHIWDYQGYVLKARMLLFMSVLDEENKDIASSDRHVLEAVTLLKQVPVSSELGGQAMELLTKIVALK